MAARQQKRLTKEMKDFENDPVEGVAIELEHDNIVHWNVAIMGPEGSYYEGGKFVINIDFSDNYPFKCPVMKFKTKIYHPNVKESSGEICDQAIKNTWVPTLNANYLIKMLKELIENPSTDAPMEADTAAVFMQDNAKFKATA